MAKNENGQTTVLIERDETVKMHMWLVKCIAKSIADTLPVQIDIEDLISAGTLGLIKAVDDFDPSRGAKLETYARYRIRGAILDELRKHDLLPYSTRSKIKQLDRTIVDLERGLRRYPTDEEIAERMGLAPDEVSGLLGVAASCDLYSLDEILENGEPVLRLDPERAVSRPSDPLTSLEREELIKVISDAIRDLGETERTVLGLYYYEGLRMREIGEVLGISESRVSQIHSKAVLLLRGRLKIHLSL
jgi:RNA polymerase sigma factor for flagellar operon FliA